MSYISPKNVTLIPPPTKF